MGPPAGAVGPILSAGRYMAARFPLLPAVMYKKGGSAGLRTVTTEKKSPGTYDSFPAVAFYRGYQGLQPIQARVLPLSSTLPDWTISSLICLIWGQLRDRWYTSPDAVQ